MGLDNRLRYLISENVLDNINHNFARIKIDSYDFLPVEKIFSFHNIIIFIKTVVNKNINNYYYNIFFEKVYMRINLRHNFFKWKFVYYKCCIIIELTILKELMLIIQANQKSVIPAAVSNF